MQAEEVIEKLDLSPHPEGGYFRETFRDQANDSRAHSTAIYYLLKAGETSYWHRVDASEVWHWYAGAPLKLRICEDGSETSSITLGNCLSDQQMPQAIVPAGHWQSAESLGDWSLVGCTVAPGFEFSGFELAPANWTPAN